MSLTTG